jgi:hypothetical protein
VKSLETVIYRRGAILTSDENGGLTFRGRYGRLRLPKPVQKALDGLVQNLGVRETIEALALRYPPRLLKNGSQMGLSIDARLFDQTPQMAQVEIPRPVHKVCERTAESGQP